MIIHYLAENGRLRPADGGEPEREAVVWTDLFDPSAEERESAGRMAGVAVPTREEMEEIEVSSRLYSDDGVAYMTVTLPSNTDGDVPQLAPVTFVLTRERLLTVRYHQPRSFTTVPAIAHCGTLQCHDGRSVLITLLEHQIDRLADVLERAGRDLTVLSTEVFQQEGHRPRSGASLRQILEAIGRKGDMITNILECLLSLERMFGFLEQVTEENGTEHGTGARLKTLAHDCRSLIEHADAMTHKVNFLLDATLGLVSIEQNAIIKIFSVAAVVFLPPTLIASVYGMNFRVMPELQWPLGYLFALFLMVASAVLPYWYFKHRGWL